MMHLTPRSRRGVSLIEGLMATMILLVGMVGVLQGLTVASLQNAMANRHTRASVIAQELMGAIEQQGRPRLVAAAGLFGGTECVALASLGVATANFTPLPAAQFAGDLSPLPPSLSTFTVCFVDFDSKAAAFTNMTPGYSAQDGATYQRLVAVYRDTSTTSNPDQVMYVGVNVGWRDAGQIRLVKRFTALMDGATTQTNLEF